MIPTIFEKVFRKLTTISPNGPVFVSYRQSDGKPLATRLAWLLRAAGFPVWHDQTDLPPGDTTRSLKKALDNGLSGAVLVITPEISESSVVKNVELPRILRLARSSRFSFAIGTILRSAGTMPDYAAADAALGTRRRVLAQMVQFDLTDQAEEISLVRSMVEQRIRALSPAIASRGHLLISTQTRVPPKTWELDGADLNVRLPVPSDQTYPSRDGLTYLAVALPILANVIPLANPHAVRFQGGMHLSIALAFGMALPATIVPAIEVVDRFDKVWRSGPRHPRPVGPSLLDTVLERVDRTVTVRRILVYVDLITERSDSAFEVLATNEAWKCVQHIRLAKADSQIDEGDGESLADELAADLRELSGRFENSEVHLLLRTPLAVAVVLGTKLNTVAVTVYEWSAGSESREALYRPVLRLLAGTASAPISEVL